MLCKEATTALRFHAADLSVCAPPPTLWQELSPFKNCVIATGGGVPTRAENWGHMQVGRGLRQLLAHKVDRQAAGRRQAGATYCRCACSCVRACRCW